MTPGEARQKESQQTKISILAYTCDKTGSRGAKRTKSNISLYVQQNQGGGRKRKRKKRAAGHRNINISIDVLQKRAGGKIERTWRRRRGIRKGGGGAETSILGYTYSKSEQGAQNEEDGSETEEGRKAGEEAKY